MDSWETPESHDLDKRNLAYGVKFVGISVLGLAGGTLAYVKYLIEGYRPQISRDNYLTGKWRELNSLDQIKSIHIKPPSGSENT